MIKFGTDGWRDLMSVNFNDENVNKVAAAISAYISGASHHARNGIVIGYDTRRNSKKFAEICCRVLRGNNIRIIETPRAYPTPVIAFAVRKKRALGAIMITASHNPADYNGIKFISEHGGPANSDITSAIERLIGRIYVQAQAMPDKKNDFSQMYDPFTDYRNHLKQLIDYDAIRKSGLKVVVDPNFGAGYGLLDMLLKKDAGLEVVAVNNYADPEFGGGMPEPSGKNLKRLAKEVEKHSADIGVSLDGDGDRFGVVDSNGFAPVPNICISIIADHLIGKGLKGKVIGTVATTHLLDKIANYNSLPFAETKVGFKYVAEEMLKDDALIGGEESGGVSVGGHLPEKDGLLGNLLLIEALAYKKKKAVSALAEGLFAKYGRLESKRTDFHMSDDEKQRVISYLDNFSPNEIDGNKVVNINKIDGYKFYLENDSWVMARASGTEPVIRVYAEAPDMSRTDKLISYVKNNIIEHREKMLTK